VLQFVVNKDEYISRQDKPFRQCSYSQRKILIDISSLSVSSYDFCFKMIFVANAYTKWRERKGLGKGRKREGKEGTKRSMQPFSKNFGYGLDYVGYA